MELEGRTFWKMFLLEALVWLIPMVLALTGHIVAYPRAKLVMEGTVKVEMNDATTRALDAWRLAQDSRWLFGIYGVVVFVVFATVRLKGVGLFWRTLLFGVLAIPGVWYLGQIIHLVMEVSLF